MHFKYEVTNNQPNLVIHYNDDVSHETSNFGLEPESMKIVKKFYNECYRKCGNKILRETLHQLDQKKLDQFLRKLEHLYKGKNEKMSQKQDFTTKTFLEQTTEMNKYQQLLSILMKTSELRENFDWKKILKQFASKVKTSTKFRTTPKAINNCFEQRMMCLYSNVTNIEHSCRPNAMLM